VNSANVRTLSPPVPPPNPLLPDNQWLGWWERRAFLELGAYPTAPGSARALIDVVLPEWDLAKLRESATVVVSELVTNSVLATTAVRWAGATPPLRLWVLGDMSRILVLAWDAITRVPVLSEAGTWDESGRGLRIVAALSARWGCYHPPGNYGGKVTWSVIDTP
jgi:hypothetical protein